MRILIVEDEEHLAIGLKFNFEAEGYEVATTADGPSALRMFAEADPPFDLIILDLMLPGTSGYEICTALRAQSRELPILVLSARTLSEDKTRAFDCGCDQYMTKPFELTELLSRVRNLLKRRTLPAPPTNEREVFSFGTARVDFRKHQVEVGGKPIKLTQMEMQLLRLFVHNEGIVLSRAEILEKVWGLKFAPNTRTVDNFVLRLRKHFEQDPANPRHFVSVRGAGYRFAANPDSPK